MDDDTSSLHSLSTRTLSGGIRWTATTNPRYTSNTCSIVTRSRVPVFSKGTTDVENGSNARAARGEVHPSQFRTRPPGLCRAGNHRAIGTASSPGKSG